MGSLTFVGLGLGAKGISLEGVASLKSSDIVYLEYYTTPHEPELLSRLVEASGKEVAIVDRNFVEDGGRILTEARDRKVVLAVLGDPMIATTHNELRVRAVDQGIETAVIHAATIASAAASASGLHSYKFSRTVTITREGVHKLGQPYHILHQNLLEGAHSLILLEHDTLSGEGVSPSDAVNGLLRAEENFKRGVVSTSTYSLVLSRVGREDMGLFAGDFREISERTFGEAPHSMLIPGTIHFTEQESVAAIFGTSKEKVRGNSDGIQRTAQVLVPRYVGKTRRALDSVKGRGGYERLVDNAELYLRDAENYLANGEDEMAMLSVGYAEGLLDSLSLSGVMKVEW